MKISWGCHVSIDTMNHRNGYGYATDRCVASLRTLGHEVVQNDPNAPVQIYFDQPQFWEWNNNNQYRIGYLPWESTKLKPGWLEPMNQVDEIWTPSPVVAEWYKKAKVIPPVYVYQHGVDDIWTPVRREPKDKIKFLHVGFEAARKGGAEVLRSFRAAFGSRDDVQLSLKMINPGWGIPTWNPRINIINRSTSIEELVGLFHEHDVFVYPSWGEGFGLNPLQAMATGMPTITLPAWAPYAHHMDPRLTVSSKLIRSAWEDIHPGKMWAPHVEDLVDNMRFAADNYESVRDFALSQTEAIRTEYDWIRLTDEAFKNLEKRLENSSKTLALESLS